jgi:hypothetical protein
VQEQIDQDLKQALLNIRNPFVVPYRAGKMEYILSGYLPEEFLCKSR